MVSLAHFVCAWLASPLKLLVPVVSDHYFKPGCNRVVVGGFLFANGYRGGHGVHHTPWLLISLR